MKIYKSIRAGLSLLGCMLLFVMAGQAQNHYAMINSGNVKNLEEYRAALTRMDLEQYREDDERRMLKFTTGVEVVLYSRSEMKNGVNPAAPGMVSPSVQILKLGANGNVAIQAPKSDISLTKSSAPMKPVPKTKATSTLPKDFPVMHNSGDKLAEQEKYWQEKLKWIEEHPEAYKRMSAGNNQVQMIPMAEYHKMPKEKQKVIKNDPKHVIKE